MTKVHIEWSAFKHACFHTARLAKEQLKDIHTIIAVSRGGLVPARVMAEYIKPQHFATIGVKLYDGDKRGDRVTVYQDIPDHLSQYRDRNLLVIDDVSDGGSTFDFVTKRIRNRTNYKVYTAAPYIKKDTKFIPDFYVTEFPSNQWIVFPFEES
jgi:hypoxanthine phosphoribosyltransferase